MHVNHVLSSHALDSAIFDILFARMVADAPEDMALTLSVRPRADAAVRHYHRPHRERRLRGPAVVTVHHDPRDTHPWLRLEAFLPRWREAEQVICLNTRQQALLAAHGIDQTVVIPHGVDRRVFPAAPTPCARSDDMPVRLGLISRRYPRGVKGEARLERLFTALDPKRFTFAFVGGGRWRDATAARAAGFGAEHHESLPYRLFGALYASLDALLILSDSEGGPACLPEALAAGVPVVARPVGMVPDWIADDSNGVILDDETFIDQIAALTDRTRLSRLAAGARATGDTLPSWAEVVARQVALYCEIGGGGCTS